MKREADVRKPKVSVCIFAYNHEKYLAGALDSVLAQVVNFEYEIVIGEDYSTDNTLQIAQGYQARFPDLVRIVQSGHRAKLKINGRATGRYNFFNALQNCQGRYIALLDGDDYWLSPKKLQRQFDFLEEHREYSLVFHNVYLGETSQDTVDSSWRTYHATPLRNDSNLEFLLLTQNIVPTSAAMLRNNIPSTFPSAFFRVAIGDWPFQVFNLNFGKVHYIDETMGVYRIGSGLWSQKNRVEQLLVIIDTYRYLPELIPQNMLSELKAACATYYRELVRQYLGEHRFFRACVALACYQWYIMTGKVIT